MIAYFKMDFCLIARLLMLKVKPTKLYFIFYQINNKKEAPDSNFSLFGNQ